MIFLYNNLDIVLKKKVNLILLRSSTNKKFIVYIYIGVWFMHCHLERHASWGMDAVIIVKNGPTKETSMKKPPPNMPKCS